MKATEATESVGFFGTGIMGEPMARNLLRVGCRVRAWNRTKKKAENLLPDGATVCDEASDVARGSNVLIIMLSSGDVIDQVFLKQPDAVVDEIMSGATVVVMSSVPVDVAKAQAKALAERGVRYIDAPVSGGERGAIDGALAIMAGGNAREIDEVRPILEVMGKVTHVGGHGAGQLAKLANQTIVGITIGAVAEAMILAKAGGVELPALLEALTGGFADSTILQQHGRRMIEGDYRPGAKASTQLKDLDTALSQVQATGLQLPLLGLTDDLYRAMCNGSRSDLDHSALALELAERCGITLPNINSR